MAKEERVEAIREIVKASLMNDVRIGLYAGSYEVGISPRSGLLEESLTLDEVDNMRTSLDQFHLLRDIIDGSLLALEDVKDDWKAPK